MTEIDIFVAKEVAKEITCTISEEQMKFIADNTLKAISNKPSNWEDSMINKQVKIVMLEAISKEVTILLESEEYKERIRKLAEETVESITTRTKELMIENTSQKLAGITVDPVYGIRSIIQQTVLEMMNTR